MQQFTDNGVIYEPLPDGTVRVVGYADQNQPVTLGTPDPRVAASANNEDERLRMARAAAARADEAALRAAAAEGRANAIWNAEHNPDGTPKPVADMGRISRLNALSAQINRTQELFNAGPGKTTGFGGWQDYLPSDANSAFDTAGASLSQQGLGAFRVPGTGTVSDRDAIMFDRANLPEASTRDAAVREQLHGLRARVAEEYTSMGKPVPEWVADPRNAMTQAFVIPNDTRKAAGMGAASTIDPIPQGYQDAHAAYIQQNGGRMNPDEYAQFRAGMDVQYGFPAPDATRMDAYRDFARRVGKPGATVNPLIPGTERPLDADGQAANNIVNNPVGAGLAGFGDMVGMGGVSALAPDQMNALGDAHPQGMGIGQIAGAISGTAGLGAVGRNTIGIALPGLMKDTPWARAARVLGLDLGYGTITGTNQGLDPGMAALASGIGSVAGQSVGKMLGGAIGGKTLSPEVQHLQDRGIPMTTGQMLGGVAKSTEDAMTSLPGVGDIINARRTEGFQGFNRAVFDDAGAPIGARSNDIQESGIHQLLGDPANPASNGLVGQAYDNATAGVRVPLDTQFATDLQGVAAASRMLPNDHATNFAKVMDNRVQPIFGAGEMTGDAYQQSMRGLKGSRASASSAAPGFDQEYRDALTRAMDTLTAQMRRGGGAGVVEGLGRADQAYRGAKTLRNAVQAAKSGSASGEVQVFTPAQANTASTQAQNKYGGGRQFAELIDAAQKVLPSKLPDSGTGKRLLVQAGIGAGAIGGGGAYSGTTGDYATPAKFMGALAVLAAGGTKGGQAALRKLLIDRPAVAKALGAQVRKRQGLFGAAAVPLMLESTK